jgi:hypothetical protein
MRIREEGFEWRHQDGTRRFSPPWSEREERKRRGGLNGNFVCIREITLAYLTQLLIDDDEEADDSDGQYET